jgi:hypothetical protein
MIGKAVPSSFTLVKQHGYSKLYHDGSTNRLAGVARDGKVYEVIQMRTCGTREECERYKSEVIRYAKSNPNPYSGWIFQTVQNDGSLIYLHIETAGIGPVYMEIWSGIQQNNREGGFTFGFEISNVKEAL